MWKRSGEWDINGKCEEKKKQKSPRKKSIKWSFIIYIPLSAIIAYAGVYAIGISSNYLQDYYMYSDTDAPQDESNHAETNVVISYDYDRAGYVSKVYQEIKFWLIDYAQIVLIPLWVLFTFLMTGILFYKRQLEKPIKILMEASEKIADNSLDFQITYQKENELGNLCQSFEKMRVSLYRNNQEMWRMLEERKNLNAAFSHDMRTPITVLKGYRDLLAKYIPEGEMTQEKVMEILQMMGSQIDRLENYTQKMNALQKLEDIIPQPKDMDFENFARECRETGEILAGDLQTAYATKPDPKTLKSPVIIRIDEELVLEVYENLLSNAVRYAENKLKISIGVDVDKLSISVEDDGKGFTDEALHQAAKPFYRGEKGAKKQDEKFHFGVGLYICKIICEKCRGGLIIENGECGGKVTAVFGEVLKSR